MSKLLRRLETELARTSEPRARAELRARIACNYARTGDFARAKSIVTELREHFGAGQDGAATIWIMLAEGLIYWFERLSAEASDRVSRAQLLSVAMKYPLGIALSSAWKANLEFEQSRFKPSLKSLELALQHAVSTDLDVFARVTMLLCKFYATAGDMEQTKHWFHRGRHYSLLDGDRASIEALQYNRAVFTFAWARCEHCFGRLDREFVARLRGELDSARNLQLLAGATALSNHLLLCHARLLALEENYEEAIDCLNQTKADGPFASYHFSLPFIDLEIAYCNFLLGRTDSAVAIVAGLDLEALTSMDLDDQLFAAFVTHQMAVADTRIGSAGNSKRELDAASEAYTHWLGVLRSDLSVFASQLPPTL